MKNTDIIYFGDIYSVNGVNFVTNLFVKGKDHFKSFGVQLQNLYCINGKLDISEINQLEIGKNNNEVSFKFKRKFRVFLSKVLNSKYSYFAWYKINKSLIGPAKSVIQRFEKSVEGTIIFQDIFTAYFYFLNNNSNKSILILHCSHEPFEQILFNYPSIRNSKYMEELEKIKELVYDRVDRVVFLSKMTSSLNEKELGNKSGFIYNGIPDIPIRAKNSKIKTLNIVCVGSMDGRKGQDVILNSIAELSDSQKENLHLHLIGDGPLLSDLKNLAKKLSISQYVTFYGVRNDVATLLSDMDVMILPSKSEGMPLCLIEGMRQGMYIMGTPVGAVPEMINDDFGQIINRDPIELSKLLSDLLNRPQLVENAKLKSREFFLNNFLIEKMIENYSLKIMELNEN